MMRPAFILILSCVAAMASAQTGLRTLVTGGPVAVGESFHIQYVLESSSPKDEIIPPDFKNFRRISGPDVYEAETYGARGPVIIKNMVFTLIAATPGTYSLPAASARVNGILSRGEEKKILVISKEEAMTRKTTPQQTKASHVDYYLRPGEDPQVKIRNNLFVKVTVDRKSCYVGQPVTATYKLYSRLESRSNIVKNPGFYGFTVLDMVGLKDRQSATEIINGKEFDVHTIRKVQLYPLRAGVFPIDPMEVANKVEFSTNSMGKTREQQISEGIYDEEAPVNYTHNKVYENNMQTAAIPITVRPLPALRQPISFTGAVGRFTVAATIPAGAATVNKEGLLELTVSGRGNFTQLEPPVIQWPAGMEGYEPEIKDTFDLSTSPVGGERKFIYRFVASTPGVYMVPAVDFVFFDPDSNRYVTKHTTPLKLEVAPDVKAEQKPVTSKVHTRSNVRNILLVIAGLVLAAGGFWIYWFSKKRKHLQQATTPSLAAAPAAGDLLAAAQRLQDAPGKSFYEALRSAIWQFLGHHLQLAGSRMSKQDMMQALQERNISLSERQQLNNILEACETGIFTNADTGDVKGELMKETRQLLASLEQKL